MGSIQQGLRLRVRDVAIIGAGPGGLAMAKYLIAQKAFNCIVIYEQRSNVGGVWNHTPLPTGRPAKSTVPQTDQYATYDELLTPVYDRLEANIPKQMMGFSDHSWPSDVQLFPTHSQVLDYLKEYSKDVKHLVRFNNTVVDVKQEEGAKWAVETRRTDQGSEDASRTSIETFDAVCVASGHYHVPYIPSVPGIELFDQQHPGVITHSKYYRAPESFTGKKVVIVGNSASGVDIGNQIAGYAKLPVVYSQKSESFLEPVKSPARLEKPAIAEFLSDRRAVKFSDGSEEADIDAIVYCTGYFYSYPFLNSIQQGPQPLITTGEFVNNLYQHLFLRAAPTLAFPLLNQKIIPFQVAESQAAVVSAVWAGRLELPGDAEMQDWSEKLLEASRQEAADQGRLEDWGRKVHALGNLRDADYINELYDWAMSADNANEDSSGKTPPHWGEWEYWLRQSIPAIKKAFTALGDKRHDVRHIEELGFNFDEWKREQLKAGVQ